MGEIAYQLAKEPTHSGEFIGLDLVPDDLQRPFWVWSGVGYHTHAARISVRELLTAWPEHLSLVSSWLEPLLLGHNHGGSEFAAAVLAAYERHHHKQAPVVGTCGP
ncbi:hypothetical protein [Marilutibacter aestuarii]|uniref:Uncharacterized protein n=1 Tax=Marilutibacter aestuarii TaxID=1706195 RepID=A0A508AVS9_9GAMM|nr:hypothetical protein [Lysobacter aestuarii]TQD51165.1 hypothetical protein FKV25_02160 [Lysobacter aestuarii]